MKSKSKQGELNWRDDCACLNEDKGMVAVGEPSRSHRNQCSRNLRSERSRGCKGIGGSPGYSVYNGKCLAGALIKKQFCFISSRNLHKCGMDKDHAKDTGFLNQQGLNLCTVHNYLLPFLSCDSYASVFSSAFSLQVKIKREYC